MKTKILEDKKVQLPIKFWVSPFNLHFYQLPPFKINAKIPKHPPKIGK